MKNDSWVSVKSTALKDGIFIFEGLKARYHLFNDTVVKCRLGCCRGFIKKEEKKSPVVFWGTATLAAVVLK